MIWPTICNLKGCSTFRPNPQLERSERGQCGVDTPHCCMLEREFDQEVAMKIESTNPHRSLRTTERRVSRLNGGRDTNAAWQMRRAAQDGYGSN